MIAVLCAFQVWQRNKFLPECPSDSLAHVAGAGLVQLLLHVVVEGGHGLLYVAQRELEPLLLSGPQRRYRWGFSDLLRLTTLNCES